MQDSGRQGRLQARLQAAAPPPPLERRCRTLWANPADSLLISQPKSMRDSVTVGRPDDRDAYGPDVTAAYGGPWRGRR